jgi:hypothetical protein
LTDVLFSVNVVNYLVLSWAVNPGLVIPQNEKLPRSAEAERGSTYRP